MDTKVDLRKLPGVEQEQCFKNMLTKRNEWKAQNNSELVLKYEKLLALAKEICGFSEEDVARMEWGACMSACLDRNIFAELGGSSPFTRH